VNNPGHTQELVAHLFRHCSGRIKTRLIRTLGLNQLELAEDIVQDALLKALKCWPYQGIPDKPEAWVTQVAKNLALDLLRRNKRWLHKQPQVQIELEATHTCPSETSIDFPPSISDDQLWMMFACCHPSISSSNQIALTLKLVCGFSTAEIARAFLSKTSAVAQRLVRAKKQLAEVNAEFELPVGSRLFQRCLPVLDTLYLMFNEAYAPSSGDQLIRKDLCLEAIRLLQGFIKTPDLTQPKAHALIALMLFQAARFDTRTDPVGDLVLLADQDRSLWQHELIHQGFHHLKKSASGNELSRFHLEAEIAAIHLTAESFEQTNWQRIVDCYDQLLKTQANPILQINRSVALIYAENSATALAALMAIPISPQIENYYPFHVAKAEILERSGQQQQAYESFQTALKLAPTSPLKRHLLMRINRLDSQTRTDPGESC